MKQLVLDLITAPAPTFGNFIPGQNCEALLALRALCAGDPVQRLIYCWGAATAGKSHLLAACRAACESSATWTPPSSAPLNSIDADLYVVDDVDALDDAAQIALFNLINAQASSGRLVVAGASAPRDLALRPELTSRLGSGLVFQLQVLSDAEKSAALQAHACQRGFALREEVSNYLLRHTRRDMRSLIRALDALDQYSLETGREITLPLIREVVPFGPDLTKPIL